MSETNIRKRNTRHGGNGKTDNNTIVDENGLRYNKEDQLNKTRVLKTAFITILMTVFIGYFVIEIFNLLWDLLVNYFLLHQETDAMSYVKRGIVLFVKGLIAAYIIVFLNKKLLLVYNDEEELSKYN